MKTILIMRHGEAIPMHSDDVSRNLTPLGHQQVEKMGLWLQKKHAPTGLLVSPYVRAQQTAEGVKKNNTFSFELKSLMSRPLRMSACSARSVS